MGHVVTCRRPSRGQGACVQGFKKLPSQGGSSRGGFPILCCPPQKL